MKLKSFKKLIKKIFNFVLDAIIPKRCIGCNIFDTWLCDSCHTTLPLLTEQKCGICKKVITPLGETCPNCQKNTAVNGIFVISSYNNELLKHLIHNFKYKFIEELSEPLGLLIAQGLTNSHLLSPDLIVPIPLHNRRLRWRGFNQADLLANSIGLTIPINSTCLVRQKYTTSQVKVKSKKKRLSNLKGAFVIQHPEKIKDKSILLVDDIVTTGSTINECAKILKNAGAKEVSAIVLTRE